MMLARLAPLLVLRSVRAMSKTVILVRHGAVDRAGGGVKPDGLYGGDVDVPLSARGEAEARARRPTPGPYGAATRGGLRVADETRGLRRAALRGGVRRRGRRGARGLPGGQARRLGRQGAAEVSAAFPRTCARFLGDYDFRPAGGAESVNDVQRRAAACLRGDVLPSIADGRVRAVVVSHLFVTRSLLALAIPARPSRRSPCPRRPSPCSSSTATRPP
ncbi:histidine phosphatase superfamily protein [Aureococcus anophagefferens]|uniref:Histidine phosphatase superfamily protein n=1 Tax=Aureococcus anophagefferens TaxID=44056 RepID=A0ABR1FNY1_AURAN